MLSEKEKELLKLLVKEEIEKLENEESTIVEADGFLELGIDDYEEALRNLLKKL